MGFGKIKLDRRLSHDFILISTTLRSKFIEWLKDGVGN